MKVHIILYYWRSVSLERANCLFTLLCYRGTVVTVLVLLASATTTTTTTTTATTTTGRAP
jgi:hypothetical protein